VNQLKELVDLVVPGTIFSILGYSLGGGIVGTFVSRYSNRVKKCVMVAPAGAGVVIPWTA